MKKHHIINSIFLLGLFYFSFSQNISGGSNQLDFIRESLRINNLSKDKIDAKGSPYINENFMTVRIKGYVGKTFSGRFNAFNGQMEINNGTDIIALNNNKPYEVTFTEDGLLYCNYEYKDRNDVLKNGFLVVVSESGNVALLKQERVKYYKKVVARTPYDSSRPARFKRENDLYYYKKEDKIIHLPTKKKELYKLFPQKAKDLKKFMKDNKLSLTEESGLTQLVNYLK